MRIIPKKTKVKIEFYKDFTLIDILIAAIGMGLELLVFLTNFQSFKLVLMFALLGVFICLYLPIDGEKLYLQLGHWLRFLFSKKPALRCKSTLPFVRNEKCSPKKFYVVILFLV